MVVLVCPCRFVMSGRGIGGKGLGALVSSHPKPAKRARSYKTPWRPKKTPKIADPADVCGSEYDLAWKDIEIENSWREHYKTKN